jgi:hypothetical protein
VEDPQRNVSVSPGRREALVVVAIVVTTFVALLPVFFTIAAPAHSRGSVLQYALRYGAVLLAALLCHLCDRRTDPAKKRMTLLLCVILALLTNYIHIWVVDNASYVTGPNLKLQTDLHESVLALDPKGLPHSYRMLPNGVIRLLELVTGDFASARDTYRNFFGVILLYVLYRFAGLFLKHGGAVLSLALWTAVSPISFRYYAGQPADPLSHLSFLLAFIFIETGRFPYLLLTISIGALAKESVLAMAGYYLIFVARDKRTLLQAIALLAVAASMFFGVRFLVLQNTPALQDISGVDLHHIADNWRNPQWWQPFLYTVGIFLPFVFLGWRNTPASLRNLVLYLLPVLFLSSLVFSWLREARNFMPLTAVLIVLTILQLLPHERSGEQSGNLRSI